MDCYGNKPTTEAGKYFRNNVWAWRPLANYVCEVAPEITSKCKYWQSNDGDGLNRHDARLLAAALEKELKEGRTGAYQARYKSEIAQMPKEPCNICAGTGIRPPVPRTGAGDPDNGGFKCNACDGEGYTAPWAASYPFSVENVEEFVEFLKGCGGFKIC